MPVTAHTSSERASGIACDVLVAGAFSDDGTITVDSPALTEAFGEDLAEHLRAMGFKGKVAEVALLPSMGKIGAKVLAVVGFGSKDKVDTAVLRRGAAAAGRRLTDSPSIATTLHDALGTPEGATAVAEGFLLGSYRYDGHKSDPRPIKTQSVVLLGADENAAARGVARAEATILARDITNEPAFSMTPAALARRAQEIADVGGLECEVWDEEKLAERDCGGILGVSQGSVVPPRLIILRHKPEGARGKIALVGKGITFDSGGLSLKPAKSMETMKTDKGGAGAVIGAMSVVARLESPVEIVAFVAASENLPSGTAIKPGDVITHYGGRTTEVLNTDAEGRLVLADALGLACEEEPDAIIDVATLTGSVQIALGKKISGLLGTDDALIEEVKAAAEDAGEPVWQLPMFEPYKSDLDSQTADVRNSGPTAYGGAIIAALFLRDFVTGDIPWAHLDIAGTGRADGDSEEITRGATGVATRTLLSWIERRGA